MHCELCASTDRMRRDGPGEGLPTGAGSSSHCEVCGRQVGGSRDRVVETIAQLARFGLTGQMLLARRRS